MTPDNKTPEQSPPDNNEREFLTFAFHFEIKMLTYCTEVQIVSLPFLTF